MVFGRDAEDLKAGTIAEYVVCFSNANGGRIFLGVDDDGKITGLQNCFGDCGHWISQAVQGHVHPHVIVEYEEVPVDDLRGGRYHRNPMLANYLRDYNYLDKTGRGISRKIIKGMLAHNGKEPAFELRDESLRVKLWA